MENRPEFNLSAALQRWRENLSQSPQFRPENVEELESHLRDLISVLQAKGLSDDEAFHIATRRLGTAPNLEPEFAKINGKEVWLDRLLWMAVGAQLLWLLSHVSLPMADAAVLGGLTGFGYHFRSAPDQGLGAAIIPGVLLIVFRLLSLTLAAWGCWCLVRRRGERLSIFASHIVRRPFFIGLTVVAGGAILVFLLGSLELLIIRWFSARELGAIGLSINIAGVFNSLVTAVTLAVLTVFLARRRLRLRTNQ